MKRVTLLLIIYLATCFSSGAQYDNDTLITQTITYHTSRAGELYVGWGLNNWEIVPDSSLWPENTIFKSGLPYTKMKNDQGVFSAAITLPKNSNLIFMFWVPIDPSGDSSDGWDTYGPIFYSSHFAESKTMHINDSALWMPDKKPSFNLLKSGWIILLLTLAISGVLLFVFRRKLAYSKRGLLTGLLFGSILIIVLTRMELNSLFNNNALQLFGAIFYDLLWLSIISFTFLSIIYACRKTKWLMHAVSFLFILFLVIFNVFSLLNIQIVRELGRPLNYQWLYYSDFMKGTDAKNAVAYTLSKGFVLNIVLLAVSFAIPATGFSFLPQITLRRAGYGLLGVSFIFLVIGFFQKRALSFNEHRLSNPFIELVASAITTETKPQLFSMSIPDSTRQYIEKFHQSPGPGTDSVGNIDNIIVFVLESTPASMVSIYDSTYNATPHVKKWSGMGTTFLNMYAHIPSTPNSMLSLIAGIYPLISFKSFFKEYSETKLTTLPAELENRNWTTSFFSSSDLQFSNMGDFGKLSGIKTIEDSRSINCKFKKFETTNSALDGLHDKCLVERYFEWSAANQDKNRYSLIWTNQTHYPYFIDEQNQTKYVNNNADLNRYLNALKDTDEAFGKLMEGLQEKGMLETTVVLVVGDHGEAFGTHNQTKHGTSIYEENVHIPCIVYNPVLFKGERNSRVTGLIDIVPTIASFTGVKKSDQWQGTNILSKPGIDSRTFFICPYSDFLFGTRCGNWKYIYNATKNTDELYDLQKDPKELINIAKQNADIVKREYEIIGGWVQYHNKKMKELTGKGR